MSELIRLVGAGSGAVQREVERLTSSGLARPRITSAGWPVNCALVAALWHKKVGVARDLAVPAGGVAELADGYGEGNGGLIVDLGAGTYRLSARGRPDDHP